MFLLPFGENVSKSCKYKYICKGCTVAIRHKGSFEGTQAVSFKVDQTDSYGRG
jgi:hypothetical protein